MTHYPKPDTVYQKRHKGSVRRADDGRLKMHPRVAHTAQLMMEMQVGEERQLHPGYRGMPHQTPNGDADRIRERLGLDGVWRFDKVRNVIRRTA